MDPREAKRAATGTQKGSNAMQVWEGGVSFRGPVFGQKTLGFICKCLVSGQKTLGFIGKCSVCNQKTLGFIGKCLVNVTNYCRFLGKCDQN